MKHTDLDQIEARAGAVPDGPWTLSDDLEGDGYPGHLWVVRTPASGPDEPDEYSAVVSIGDRALGEFIAHTREDVAAMAAEIRRLRAELATAREQAITDVGNWLSEHGQKDAAYLVRTVDIPAADSVGPDRCSGCRYVPCADCAAVSAAARP